jgi:hypothetical protein
MLKSKAISNSFQNKDRIKLYKGENKAPKIPEMNNKRIKIEPKRA